MLKRFLITAMLVSISLAARADTPRCNVISGHAGGPAIVIDGKSFSPLLFIANNQFGKDDVLLHEITLAGESGVDLFGFNLNLEWFTSSADTAAVVDKFCSANPEGYFLVRIWLGPNHAWADQHPDDCIVQMTPDGDTRLTGLASPSSEAWRNAARILLETRVHEIANGPHGNRFIGVIPTYLQTGEWFYPETDSFMDYSPANLKAFRQWLRKTYVKEERFRTAWNQPDVSFDTAGFPLPEARDSAAWGPFRDVSSQQSAIDMQRFQADLIADTIAYFAKAVKDATAGRVLVGAFYGYAFELNHNGPRALAHSGHLALSRLLQCPDIDMIHAPFSYFERAAGQPGHVHGPLDSIALHNKLHICEEDVYTHLTKEPPDRAIAPGWEQHTLSSAETFSVVARDFGNAFGRGAGVWIFDLLSDGRWMDQAFWREMTTLRRIAAELRARPRFEPQVAVLVDEQSPHYMRATTHPHLLQALAYWRSELDRIGTPIGYYLLSDFPLLPKSVKVIILPAAYSISRDTRRALRNFYARGGTCVMAGTPDIVGPEGTDFSRIGDITGMRVKPGIVQGPVSIRSVLTEEVFQYDGDILVAQIDDALGTDPVARFAESGAICAAATEKIKGVCVYTAAPRLPFGLMREICSRAGVHLYRDTPGATAIVGNHLIVHSEVAGPQAFRWPTPWKAVERIYPAGPAPKPGKDPTVWHDALPAKSTAIYKITQ